MSLPIHVSLVVEGQTDERVLTKIINTYTPGLVINTCFGKRGIAYIREKAHGFAKTASSQSPYICLIDLDREDCPLKVIGDCLPDGGHDFFVLRVAVKEVEAWLLADAHNMARFLSAPSDKIPRYPDQCADPKRDLIDLARRHGNTKLKRNLVPDEGSSAKVGRSYGSEIDRFIIEHWDIAAAQENSPSLRRAIAAVQRLETNLSGG